MSHLILLLNKNKLNPVIYVPTMDGRRRVAGGG